MHLWSMCVLNRMQKKNNLMTKLTIVTSWKKTAQTMRETTRKSLLKHTLFGDFAKLISICIEFTILPGLPSTFKGFLSQSDFNSYSYQVSPSIFSGFWADFRVLSVRSRPSVSDAVSHMGKRWSGTIPRRGFQSHGQFDDPSWVEPQRPPRSTHLSGRGGILLSFQPCGRSTYAPVLAT